MLLALIRKEIYNLFRNRLLLGMVVMYPIVVLMLLPFATTTDIKNLQTIVIDHDHTSLSQRLQQQFFSSGYFVNAWQGKLPPTLREGMELIEDGKADLIITIPLRFEEQLMRDQKAQLEARINAFNATKGAVAGGYTQQIVQQFVAQLNESTGLEELATIPLRIVEVNRYNPEGNYKNYIIPGLVAMLITITAFVLPALNMVQEKEVGTIEQMNVTPIHPLIFMLSKALPYLVIAVGMALISLPIVGLMYGLWPHGNMGMMMVATMLYVLAMSGLGLLITNFARTQQQAMFSFFFVMMFLVLLGGLFTPIEGMPSWARVLAVSHPFTHYNILMRTYYLKPVAFTELWRELTALSVFAVVNGTAAILTYRKRA